MRGEEKYNKFGEEIMDDTPVEIPAGLKRPPSIHEMIKQYVRTEMSKAAEAEGMESFEEANDFGDEDELDLPLTPHELRVMIDEDVVSHVERERLDSRKKKGYHGGTVNSDRDKGDKDVRHSRVDDDRKRADPDGEVSAKVGGEGGSAGERGGGVSEGGGGSR